jgi:Cache domain
MKMSVGGRIFLGIVFLQLASAALILGWFFYSVRAELNAATRHSAQAAVLRSIDATQAYFRPAEAVTVAAQRLLAAGVLTRDRPDQIERYFFEQLRELPQFAGLYVGYPDGAFFYVMRSDTESAGGTRTKEIRPGPNGREVELIWRDQNYATVKTARDPDDTYDPRARPWYAAAIEQQTSVWTKPYIFFTSRKPGITAAIAVRNGDGGVAAVVGADIEMSEVSTFLSQIGLGLGGSAYIAMPDGEVIAHSGADLITNAAGGNDSLRFRKIGELGGVEGALGDRVLTRFAEQANTDVPAVWEEDSGGQEYFVAVGRMPDAHWPWLIVVIAPQAGLAEVAGASNLVMIGVVLLATLLACAIGYAMSRSFGRPLAALHRNAKLARRGNIEVMDEIASGYTEIDETADSLYGLAEQIRHGAPRGMDTAAERTGGGGQSTG